MLSKNVQPTFNVPNFPSHSPFEHRKKSAIVRANIHFSSYILPHSVPHSEFRTPHLPHTLKPCNLSTPRARKPFTTNALRIRLAKKSPNLSACTARLHLP